MSEHGGDAARVAEERSLDLSSIVELSASLNPFAPDVAVLLRSRLGGVSRYPDDARAHQAAALALEVDPGELLLTNGGAEAIALVADHLFANGIAPSLRESDFSLYRRHLRRVDPLGPLFASNPASPGGGLDPNPVRSGVVVWDEAFWPLATGTWTSGAHRNGIIVTGSFTKVFACPGLRLGYVLAPSDVIAALSVRRPRWSVSTLAADVLPELLAQAQLPSWRDAIASRRAELIDRLCTYGWSAQPGVNWVLAKLSGWSGAQLREALLDHRILVRDCASFGLPETVRIALPRTEDVDALDAAVAAVATLPHPRGSLSNALTMAGGSHPFTPGCVALVLGGSRSGKSEHAEDLVTQLASARTDSRGVRYIATWAPFPGEASDPTMQARICIHQQRRPTSWLTSEASGEHLAELLRTAEETVLVDSLGTWLSGHPNFACDIAPVIAALQDRSARGLDTVIVSDEVGLGVHPSTTLGGEFRDALGSINRAVADACTHVELVVAGQVLRIKPQR